jgi:hypothetical protein
MIYFVKILCPVLAAFIMLVSCDEDPKPTPVPKASDESAKNDSSKLAMECDTFPTIEYTTIRIKDSAQLESIRSTYGFETPQSPGHRVITTLNRKEFRFFKVGDSIVTPSKVETDLKNYSMFPPCYPAGRDIPKIVFISNKYQCYVCYEKGRQVRFAAANTGKEKTPTYPGRYNLTWRKLLHHSSLDSSWVMPFTFNFHLQAGNAFHQFTMPGRPVSHSCVRQFAKDAEWFYNWGDRARYDSTGTTLKRPGTTVIILDVFDFSRKKFGPWLDLKSNKDLCLKLPDKPMEYEEALIPISQIPKDARGSLTNISRYETAEEVLRNRGVIRSHVQLTTTRNFNHEKKARSTKRIDSSSATTPITN